MPSGAWLIGFIGFVIVLIVYFIVTLYSNSFVQTSSLTIFEDAQNDFLTRMLVYAPWVGWIDRSLDFLFWGAIAAIGIVIAWAVSSTKVSIANHKIIQQSSNFSGTSKQWNKGFAAALGLRIILVFIALYMAGALITKFMPNLSGSIGLLLYRPNVINALKVIPDAFFCWLMLAIIASCVKAFRQIDLI